LLQGEDGGEKCKLAAEMGISDGNWARAMGRKGDDAGHAEEQSSRDEVGEHGQ
jgi:hypothetical protein